MPIEKQIQASRANGARSRGPTSAQGKKNSSRNALRHGLFAGTVVLQGEAEDPLPRHGKDCFEWLAPEPF